MDFALALIELLAGQHVLYFGNIAGIIGYVRTNRMRALAVTGEKRSPSVPDIPTVIEAGLPGFVVIYGSTGSRVINRRQNAVRRFYDRQSLDVRAAAFASRCRWQTTGGRLHSWRQKRQGLAILEARIGGATVTRPPDLDEGSPGDSRHVPKI